MNNSPWNATMWISLVVIGGLVVVYMFVSHRIDQRSDKVFVLGQQLADAAANEAKRLSAGPIGPSPMPKESYDFEREESGLLFLKPLPLDAKLQVLTKNFLSWNAEQRREAQDAISMDEQYTLIHFAKRSAVFAMRENSTTRCEEGLTALAMMDETRIDPRDGFWARGLLECAITSTRTEREPLLERIIPLARPGMAELMRGLDASTTLANWSYAEVRNEDGELCLINRDLAPYNPTLDMTKLAIKIAEMLQKDRYTAGPTIAAELPPVWFPKQHRAASEALLKKANACIAVNGYLRKRHDVNSDGQYLMLWVIEMPTEQAALQLGEYSPTQTRRDNGRFITGVSSGHLFSIIVAGSMMAGVEPLETSESVTAIAEETRRLLQLFLSTRIKN